MRGRSPWAVVSLLVALFLTTVSVPAQEPESPQPGATVFDEGAMPFGPGGARVEDAFWPARLRDAIEAGPSWDEDARAVLAGAGGTVPVPAVEGAAASFVNGSSFREAFRVGDLDGDGLDDALVVERSAWGDSVLRGIRGTDGAELWDLGANVSSYAFTPTVFAAGDLTGDGADDVMLLALRPESFGNETGNGTNETGPQPQSHDWISAWMWELEVRSGATGETVWSMTLHGEETRSGGAITQSYGETNSFLLPVLSDDHDGDGAPDLVLNAFGFENTYVLSRLWRETTRTDARVLSGATGAELMTVTESVERDGLAFMLPAGDATGSEVGDLLWQRFAPSPLGDELYLEMRDGENLSRVAWRDEQGDLISAPEFAVPMPCDLTGDGKADFVVFEDWRFDSDTLAIRSGSDGSLAWRDEWFYPLCLGALGGAPGDDLLAIEPIPFAVGGGFAIMNLPRRDGPTGEFLFTTVVNFVVPEDRGFSIYLRPLGDGDADGVLDVVIYERSFVSENSSEGHEHGENGTTTEVDTEIHVDSGADGALLRRTLPGYATPLAAGDLNADDRDDVLAATLEGSYSRLDLRLDAMPVGVADEGWSVTRTFARTGIGFVTTGDQSGDGAADAILTMNHDYLGSRVEGVSGADGSTRWAYGDELAVPPPAQPQNDAGTGADAPDDFFAAPTLVAGSYEGFLDAVEDFADMYRIDVPAESAVEATVTPLSGQRVAVVLYQNLEDEWGETYPRDVDASEPGEGPKTVRSGAGEPSTFWLRIASEGSFGNGTDPDNGTGGNWTGGNWTGGNETGNGSENVTQETVGPEPASHALPGNYSLVLTIEPLDVQRHRAESRVACAVGSFSCGDNGEGPTFNVSARPAHGVVGLRYEPSMPGQRLVVDAYVNDRRIAIMTTAEDVVELSAEDLALFGPLGGDVRFQARAANLGAGGVPGGAVIDQPYEVCAAFAAEPAPGLACFAG